MFFDKTPNANILLSNINIHTNSNNPFSFYSEAIKWGTLALKTPEKTAYERILSCIQLLCVLKYDDSRSLFKPHRQTESPAIIL